MLAKEYPIIQRSLASSAYSDLAAAVSDASDLGQVTAINLENTDELKAEIKCVKIGQLL